MKELLLLRFHGIGYGIWKDEIHKVQGITSLYRSPLFPDYIAGMSHIGGRATTLADLSACLGLPPMQGESQLQALILSERDKVCGFGLTGETWDITISRDKILSLPTYLTTEVIDTCVIHDSIPVPLINIQVIFKNIQEANHQTALPEFRLYDTHPQEISSLEHIRIFEISGQSFAFPANGIESCLLNPNKISELALLPAHIPGLLFQKEKLLTLINLAQLLRFPDKDLPRNILINEINGYPFGFLVDTDKGEYNKKEIKLSQLPPLAQSKLIQHAGIINDEIIPVVDPERVVSVSHLEPEDINNSRYNPDPQFVQTYSQHEIKVVEFSILGVKYSIPENQTEDSFEIRRIREIPDIPPIVIGIAEHNNELLPVLDLAMCFGRKSILGPDWSMLLISNGDFRALVITETIFGVRTLPVNIQCKLPVVLQHNTVYGCYPTENLVCLILNIESIAVHFDKSLVKEFSSAISNEMKQAPAEIILELPEVDVIPGEKIIPAPEIAKATGNTGRKSFPEKDVKAIENLQSAIIKDDDIDEILLVTPVVTKTTNDETESSLPEDDSETVETLKNAIIEDNIIDEILLVTPEITKITGRKIEKLLPENDSETIYNQRRIHQSDSLLWLCS